MLPSEKKDSFLLGFGGFCSLFAQLVRMCLNGSTHCSGRQDQRFERGDKWGCTVAYLSAKLKWALG